MQHMVKTAIIMIIHKIRNQVNIFHKKEKRLYYGSISLLWDTPKMKSLAHDLQTIKNSSSFCTERKIKPYNLELDGLSYSRVKRYLLKQSYGLKQVREKGSFYSLYSRFTDNDLKVRSQFHFYGNEFFAIKTSISAATAHYDLSDFWNALLTKYDQEKNENSKIWLRDASGNCMLMEYNHFSVVLYYFRPENIKFQKAMEYLTPTIVEDVEYRKLEFAI
jgi:hypothetical protein